MSDKPPFIAHYVAEVDIKHDRETPLFVSLWGPFHSRKRAETERDRWQETWQQFLAEQDGENPYDFKGWQIVEQKLHDFKLDKLDRQSEESHRITMDAVNAVGASLLAKEGIGPYAEDDDE